MALPTTGQLSMSQVRTELGGSGAQSLSAAGVTLASITAGNKVALFADLAGTSAGSNIIVDYSASITYFTNTDPIKDGYRPLVMSGRQAGDIFTLNLQTQFNEQLGASAIADLSYRRNGGLWTTLGTWTASIIANTSITGIDSNDTIDIRMGLDLNIKSFDSASMTTTITGGTITTGSGTVTASGTVAWSFTCIPVPP